MRVGHGAISISGLDSNVAQKLVLVCPLLSGRHNRTNHINGDLADFRPRTLGRLSEMEYVALGIMAIADLGAFEFPLAFHGIHGATKLCRTLSGMCDVLNTENELEGCIFARFRGRGDVNRVCDALWNT
jgi:hypothetical protein